MSLPIEFTAFGVAQPRGSKKAIKSPHMKFAAVVDSCEASGPWMEHVRQVAAEHYRERHGEALLKGPIRLTVWFYFPYLASHYGSGKNSAKLKESAPDWIFSGRTGDIDKLVRGVQDALKYAIYEDDKQVCDLRAHKLYTTAQPRALIRVEALEPKL